MLTDYFHPHLSHPLYFSLALSTSQHLYLSLLLHSPSPLLISQFHSLSLFLRPHLSLHPSFSLSLPLPLSLHFKPLPIIISNRQLPETAHTPGTWKVDLLPLERTPPRGTLNWPELTAKGTRLIPPGLQSEHTHTLLHRTHKHTQRVIPWRWWW